MKKIALVAVLFAVSVAAIGCGGTASTKSTVTPASTPASTPK